MTQSQTTEIRPGLSSKEFFREWCKTTKRSGGVLIGSSVREFLDAYARYLEQQPKPKPNEENDDTAD